MKFVRNCLIAVLLFFAVLSLSCGYRLAGTGNQIPDHIKRIVIPEFGNKTIQFQAVQFVTFSIRDEFIKKSELVLVNDIADADSVLEGEIVTFDVKPLSFESASGLQRIRIVLNVKFIDLKYNRIIFENTRLSFTHDFEMDSGDFFSQDDEIKDRIARKFSSSMVATILEDF